MRWKGWKSVMKGGAALFVVGSLLFGATQALGSATTCPPPAIGTCPPFTNGSCDDECVTNHMAAGGECISGCCECFF